MEKRWENPSNRRLIILSQNILDVISALVAGGDTPKRISVKVCGKYRRFSDKWGVPWNLCWMSFRRDTAEFPMLQEGSRLMLGVLSCAKS
jgi:hypothetical protein